MHVPTHAMLVVVVVEVVYITRYLDMPSGSTTRWHATARGATWTAARRRAASRVYTSAVARLHRHPCTSAASHPVPPLACERVAGTPVHPARHRPHALIGPSALVSPRRPGAGGHPLVVRGLSRRHCQRWLVKVRHWGRRTWPRRSVSSSRALRRDLLAHQVAATGSRGRPAGCGRCGPSVAAGGTRPCRRSTPVQ